MTTSKELEPGADQPVPTRRPPDRQLQDFVTDRVRDLARRYLADNSAAVASLARLRRVVDHEAGSDPTVWPETLGDLPPVLVGAGDAPSRYERAAHSAITLFALHQQAKNTSVHKAGSGLGGAVRRLGNGDFSEEATLRRFKALATASSYREINHHLRGLVSQLRAAGIPLDYGQLARDLSRLQSPKTADSVRLNWGRDYYRPRKTDTDSAAPATESTTA